MDGRFDSAPDLTQPGPAWRRLHPTALVVESVDSITTMVSLTLSLLVTIRIIVRDFGPWVWALLVLAAVAVLVRPAIIWLNTRYRLDADGLSFRSGLFFRKRRAIGYDRIHAISATTPWYMRPFNVVRLTVASGGTADVDITLDAVPVALQLELERLRQTATNQGVPADVGMRDAASISMPAVRGDAATGKAGASAGMAGGPAGMAGGTTDSASGGSTGKESAASNRTNPILLTPHALNPHTTEPHTTEPHTGDSHTTGLHAPNRPVFRASVRDIILFATTDIGVFAAALVVLGFVQQLEDLVPSHWVDVATDSVGGFVARGAFAIAALALAVAAALLAVSIVTSMLRFYGFEVWRRGDDLVVTRGLLTRRTMTIPVSRIQTITIKQSLPRKALHLCSAAVGLSTSTAASGDAEAMMGTNVLPVISDKRVWDALRDMLPEWDVREPEVIRTGRGLERYYLITPAVLGTLVTLVFLAAALVTFPDLPAYANPWWWAVAAGVVATVWWLACRWLKARTEGYELRSDGTGALDGKVSHARHTPMRIAVTGASALSERTMFTRRSRVQSVRRTTTPWRMANGVEQVSMPLFVMNGQSELRFHAIRSKHVAELAEWAAPEV
ncbi:bacterial membrane flanked domain superfamily [Bifidobacterium lemurum]|uniref:Bacterial membrane flanked domain superfamily n=1 Tax=Bifidobacterium lemurum TaxID=1603886 RepID=A0A261FS53_9BIFI|nr:PH domain-containing protein [Bifidobacterium lemurum]OZG62020.1 bacterial membrane flanked domain superfamily [Bifidobacterium lemurum]